MKVSIIVPIYNKINYLERFITKVSEIKDQDYELILVDNNSIDGSYEYICSKAKENPLIRVFKETNQGTNCARLNGFKNAIGDYIMFIDPDDEINPLGFQHLAHTAFKVNADMVIADYIIHNKNEVINKKGIPFLNDDTKKIESFISDNRKYILIGALWNKIIKKEAISEEYFCFTNCGEDGALLANIFYNIKDIYYLKENVYDYYRNSDSITMNPNIDTCYHLLNSLYFVYDKLSTKKDYNTFKLELEYYFAKHLLGLYVRTGNITDRNNKKELAKAIKDFYEIIDYDNNSYIEMEPTFKIIQRFLLNDLLRPVIYQNAVTKLGDKVRAKFVDRYIPKTKKKS